MSQAQLRVKHDSGRVLSTTRQPLRDLNPFDSVFLILGQVVSSPGLFPPCFQYNLDPMLASLASVSEVSCSSAEGLILEAAGMVL